MHKQAKDLSREDILAIFKAKNVLLEGHFKLTSGRHGAQYLQCSALLQYPEIAAPLLEHLASFFSEAGTTVVAGSAAGGIIISYEIARALGLRSVFFERENGELVLCRGFEIYPEDRVLVVEDVITTGGSSMEIIRAVKDKKAQVLGIACIADRSGGMVDMGVPIKALLSLAIKSYSPEECPLCALGIPAKRMGRRQ